MSGVLCLKWNNHTSTFIKSLDVLRTKELYCDATIACQGKYFPVHRFVLTTCSEYFEEIFERTQCKHPFIIVKDVEELQLEALLNYMYKGEVNVLQDRLPGLIRAAEALKVKGLAVSEDNSEERKPIKEKRKSHSSSPLQPKSKRKVDDRILNSKPLVNLQPESDDDEITEIDNSSSNNAEELPEECLENSNPQAQETNLNFKSITESKENEVQETDVEDIKVEPSDIFEAVEEELLPNAVESQLHDNGSKEDSLFVSLLSPNNTHMSEEDLMAMNDSDNHAMPQCSSWNDEVSNNSDKTHDEIAGKSQWLESEDFDHLAVGSRSYEETSIKYSFDGSHNSSDNNNKDEEDAKSPYGKFPAAILPDCSEVLDNSSIDFIKNLKEEFPLIETQGLSDTSLSSIAALSKFQFADCTPSGYASLLMDDPSFIPPASESDSSELLGSGKPAGTSNKFHCISCSFKCKDKAALKLHIMRKHTGEKPYSCAICPYRCTTKDMLKIHTRKHTGERPFSCPYCNIRMSVKSSLKRHILLKHIQGRRQQSPREENPKGFTESSSSVSPKASGSSVNIKTYRCQHCSYETQLKSNLNLHNMRIHTGEKPIACVICPFRTTTKSQLQKHMRKHTGERPYACSFCSYRAAQKHCLLRHMYIHTR